ncbi:MAG: hypothetical protein II956_00105 [Bacteroidales bacterium]|nr:hypothetical protein [Bacteroidales bacterium]
MRIKSNLILSAFAVTLSLFSVACQQDIETEVQTEQQQFTDFHDYCLNVPDTSADKCISKAVLRKKYSTVVINDTEYRTIKIRNREATIMQEWLLEDLHEDMFTYTPYHQDNDPYGKLHGFYYPWCGELDDVIQADWDEFIPNAPGFRIPTAKDLTDLGAVVGKNNRRSILEVEYDGFCEPSTPADFSYRTNNGCGFWVNCQNDPSRVDGCGVIGNWYKDDAFVLSFTNIKDICCNVRLVRTLTKSQW